MLSEKKKKLLEFYNQGLELYKQRNFKDALKFFQQAKQVEPEDGPTNLYIERCQTYIIEPPPEDWDGVFVMTTK